MPPRLLLAQAVTQVAADIGSPSDTGLKTDKQVMVDVLVPVLRWMNLNDTLLCERSQTRRHRAYDVFYGTVKNGKIHTGRETGACEGREERALGSGGCCAG